MTSSYRRTHGAHKASARATPRPATPRPATSRPATQRPATQNATPHAFAETSRRRRSSGRVGRGFAVLAASGAFALMAISAIAPPPPARAVDRLHVYLQAHAQSLTIPSEANVETVNRDGYTATAGLQTLTSHATNRDWATMVLMLGKWPMSNNNITVLTRWMRQENGPNNWWNRNNPLNNGWGSGGHAGTGNYPNLVVAAQNAAAALHKNPGYSGIVAALAKSAPMDVTASAIWASPWATSHYANGTHWSTATVPEFVAPTSAWG